MYLGAKDDDVMIRLMDKIIDGQRLDGAFIALAEDDKRVRIEVAVRGGELITLGLVGVETLRRFKFKTLQKRYFQFKLPTFSQRQKPLTGADVIQNTKQKWRALGAVDVHRI